MMVRNAASTSARSGRSDAGRSNFTRSSACTFEIIALCPYRIRKTAPRAAKRVDAQLDARRQERFLAAERLDVREFELTAEFSGRRFAIVFRRASTNRSDNCPHLASRW